MLHVHAQQADLDLPLGEYPIIDELKVNIKPFAELWDTQLQFEVKIKEWEGGRLENLKPDDVETDFRKMFSTSTKLANKFESMKQPKPAMVATNMKKRLTDFRPYQPIIRALCNPGLQERHIDDIYKLINKPRDDGAEIKD